MIEIVVEEKHLIQHEDYPANPLIILTCKVTYRIMDDGFITAEYEDVNYECWGTA